MKKVTLSNRSILLRPYTLEDADSLYQAVRESISQISPWMPWCSDSYSLSDSKKWIEHTIDAWSRKSEYDFAIIDRNDGKLIGGCGLNNVDKNHRVANLGYWVKSSKTSQGVASSATRLLANFAFKRLELNRIEIISAVGNTASQRAAVKSGATREGILRHRIVVRDKVYDAAMFSLVPEDM